MTTHTPVTLMQLFADSFTLEEQYLTLQGMFHDRQRQAYGGYTYDRLKDEATGQLITIRVPNDIKLQLTHENSYVFQGYLRKDVRFDGVIEPVFTIHSLLNEVVPLENEASNQRFLIQQEKRHLGYKDAEQVIRQVRTNGRYPHIVIIRGKTSIVMKDIYTTMRESRMEYQITEHRANLVQVDSIIEALKQYQTSDQCDLLAVACGGGPVIQIFDDLRIAEEALKLQVPLMTAIGHADTVTLLDRISDHIFTTPTAFGAYLRDLVQDTQPQASPKEAPPLIAPAHDSAQEQKLIRQLQIAVGILTIICLFLLILLFLP